MPEPSQRGSGERALLQVFPRLAPELDLVRLGDFPTPVTPLPTCQGIQSGMAYVKRDDLSSPVYGGNKVRTLELLFGAARKAGAQAIFATGAYGSNHAVATVLHAASAGLKSGALLFPQPISWAALENLCVSSSLADKVIALAHWSSLPLSMWWTKHRAELGATSLMLPGGATPLGALGYVSAGLELGLQVHAKLLPEPARVIVGVGSTCTSAGLLVGFRLAQHLGLGFPRQPPELVSVRVTPWPVTSVFRITRLAARTAGLLAALTLDSTLCWSRSELARNFRVESGFLGRGYGKPTSQGREAGRLFTELGLPGLDTTYSAKAGAAFLALCRGATAPTLFWSTKSSAPLPDVELPKLQHAPARIRRWILRAERTLAPELPQHYRRLGSSWA